MTYLFKLNKQRSNKTTSAVLRIDGTENIKFVSSTESQNEEHMSSKIMRIKPPERDFIVPGTSVLDNRSFRIKNSARVYDFLCTGWLNFSKHTKFLTKVKVLFELRVTVIRERY